MLGAKPFIIIKVKKFRKKSNSGCEDLSIVSCSKLVSTTTAFP